MKGRPRYLVFLATALLAGAIALPAGQAAGRNSGNDWVTEMARANVQRPDPTALRGRWVASTVAAAPSAVSRQGFDWADAGIGAATMLGVIVLVGGLGFGLIVRNHHREAQSV